MLTKRKSYTHTHGPMYPFVKIYNNHTYYYLKINLINICVNILWLLHPIFGFMR